MSWAPDAAFWQDRRVLVTGAYGFLGAHVTAMLVEHGAEIVAVVRDDVPATPITTGWADWVTRVWGDTADQALVERALGDYSVTTVFHLAAQTQVGVANRNPVSSFESNVRGTWSVLEACRRSPRVAQVVVASSDKAYGDQAVLPYTEDLPLTPTNPYDVSKACADLIASSYHAAFALPVAITRCGNLYGPGDTNWDRLVPGVIRDVLRGRRPVIRSDGSPTRDYLHVTDGAGAALQVAEALAQDPAVAGEAFNFSTETPMSVLEVVQAIAAEAGHAGLEADIRNDAPNEIADQFLSAEKARRVLSWKPRFSMDDGLAQTVPWYRAFLGDATP